jgi:hypothetical protein
MKRTTLLVLPLAFGLAACGGEPAKPAVALPAPTVTVTATPEPAAPVTKIVEHTPQACLDALDAAADGFSISAKFSKTAAIYPPLISKAFEAGATGNQAEAQDVIDSIKSGNVQLQDVTDQLNAVAPRWQEARDKCQAGATE